MNRSNDRKYRSRQAEKALTFKLSPLAAACATAMFAVSVHAQTAPADAQAPVAKKDAAKPATLETVVVTGIRRGIEDAISVKQSSSSIVEAISAEDIGKLPDNSIAESIARLPGLAAQRVAGRASTISIRGMSGDFASTLLNGREQVSTGDNRAVEFDQYPSELLSGVVIYKTPDAALIGQGLSGTVDLQTVRPLSFGKRTVAVSLRGEKNSLGKLNADSKDQGHRISASYINQSADKTFGIALGYARLESPSQVQRWEAWGYASATVNGKELQALGGNKIYAESTEATRDGLMAVLEWKPNKNFTSLLDLYYSKFDKKTASRGMEFGTVWGAEALTNPVFTDSVLTGGTWIGIKPVLRNDLNKRTDDLVAVGLNNKLKLNNGWTVVGDLSFSKADRDESILETYAGTTGAKSNFVFNQNQDTGLANYSQPLNFADPSIIKLVDSGGWGQDGYIKYPKVTDELKSMRLSGKRDMDGLFSAMEFGVNYSERTKTRVVPEFFVNLKSSPTTVPGSLLLAPANLSFVGLGSMLAYNIDGAFGSLYNQRANFHKDITNKDWTVKEKVFTSFGKLDFDQDLGGVQMRGNVGAQVIRTDQSSNAFAVGNGNAVSGAVPYSAGKTYTDVLPSANIAFTFAGEQTLRFGAAKTMVRARLDQLRASNNFSLGATDRKWSGDGGNPQLDPFRANAFDVSYEKYFGTKAYVGVAWFHKDLKSYVYQDTIPKDFTGYPNPSNGAIIPISNIGNFSTPINGQGGRMDGVEVSASLPLNMLTSMLDGFGVVLSFADTESSIKPNGPNGGSQPLPGLSRRVTNLTAYYEKYGFSARVSQRERSDFVGEVTGFGADREFRYIKGDRVVDLQLGYAFETGPLKGLSVLFQVNNLTNEPYRTYDTTPNKPNQYTTYGKTTLLGVNYKF